jgi:chaperone modulatory protein CbpM
VTARTAFRLRHDFELDEQGLAVALALLERVRDLEAELDALRAQLPGRIG